jgi:glycosyltransferase involved in cell wall biosynthesis
MQPITSHTLVKNGKPFIDLVLRQAEPFVDKMLITISERSDDGTLELLRKFERDYPRKVEINFENVADKSLLTGERQKQLDKTIGGWVWFLDDDDFWPTDAIVEVVKLLNEDKDVDGYSFNPYQLIDLKTHDDSWRIKSFTKFFKKQDGVHYEHPWPRDLIYKGKDCLHWRRNHRVPHVQNIHFFHLSNLKNCSFRNEEWSKGHYIKETGEPNPIPYGYEKEMELLSDVMFKYGK